MCYDVEESRMEVTKGDSQWWTFKNISLCQSVYGKTKHVSPLEVNNDFYN
jgi:hypothetical protein